MGWLRTWWSRRRRGRPIDTIAAGEPRECRCACHDRPFMMTHVQPCCRPCERCGVLFAAGLDAHRAECGP